MSFSKCEQAYIAGISLNNAGVSLLQRHCYRQAGEIFSEAVSVMREISALSSSSHQEASRQRSRHFPLNLEASLAKANQELATAVPEGCSKRLSFCVFTEEETYAVIGEALQQDEDTFLNPSSTTFLTRIEMRGSSIQDFDPLLNVDLTSAIILNNFGNSYKGLAVAATTAESAHQFLTAAFKLFELSHSLLQNHADDDDYVPMSILIVGNLVELASILRLDDVAEAYYDHMWGLQETFLEMKWLLSATHQIAAAAA